MVCLSDWLSDREVVSKYKTEIHCGVVGNIQAFHVCAPGSIPGDGVFILKYIREQVYLEKK